MDKKLIFNFLRDLSKNNSKEWMNEHRNKYIEAKNIWLNEIEIILNRLSLYDENLKFIRPIDTISRINNNRRFHPDKPIYKDNFTFTPYNGMFSASFHISLSPEYSFMGGGIYHPDNFTLNKIREAIDYDGSLLMKILNSKKFIDFYGSLDYDSDQLKSAPKGYNKDHKYIDLLKRRNFTAIIELTQKEVISEKFVGYISEAFISIKPLIDYLNNAIAFKS